MLRGNSRANRPFARYRKSVAAPRAGGIRRKLLVFLVLIAVIVALLPTIVANTPLRNMLVAAAMPSDAVRVSIGGASLSWISGPSLSGITVADSAGNTLVTADSIAVDRAPASLLLNSRDLGIIRIQRPTMHLKVRPDGSNLEDALQQLLADLSQTARPPAEAPGPAGQPVAFAVQVADGTIFAEDVATGRMWRVDGVHVQYDCHGAGGGWGNGSLSGQIAVAGPGGAAPLPAGRFAIVLKPNGVRNELTLLAEGVALGLAQPWLHRLANVTDLSGTFSGSGIATWSAGGNSIVSDLNTSGTLSIDGLDIAAPQFAGDRVRLARVEVPWRIAAQPAGLAIEDLQLKSDIGQMSVRGRLDPALMASARSAGAAPFLFSGRNDIELRGAIDIARVAAMLPHALGIRGDTTITSGSIELAGRLQPTAAGQSLSGSIRTAQLAATSNGKPFRWDQPMSANFAVRRESGRLALETLQCNSNFLRIEASGTLQQLTANASFDLNSLGEQLGQFIDLSQVRLAGTGTARLNWQQTEADKFNAQANAEFAQVVVVLGDGATWAEPKLTMETAAHGLLDPTSHRPTRVDAAKLVIAGEDQAAGQSDVLDAQISSPINLMSDAPIWPVTVRATGSIARWLTRARPWFAPGDWKIDGTSEVMANIRASNSAVNVTGTKVIINNLQATSRDWKINEPRVELAGDAHWNRATGEIASSSAQFVTSTVSIATKDVRYAGGTSGIGQLAGAAAFRADLARLAAWQAPTNAPSQYQPAGEFTGNVRFSQQAGRITGEISATGQNLSLASRGAAGAVAQTIWQEPRLVLRGTTDYNAANDRLAFDQLQIQSNTLQASVAGQIERLSTAAECNLGGAVNYDLAQLSPLLRPYIGEGIQLNGREQARFALTGKLTDSGGTQAQLAGLTNDPYRAGAPAGVSSETHWSRRIRAQLELPWSGANVYGLPVGAGKLAATLGDGSLQIAPLALAVGEGRLNLSPNLRFDPEPAQLTMPAGPVITNVRISPEVSEAMLKYVAPVLSGATQSEGQFSLGLDGLRMPLADSKKTDSAGKLTVHNVRVVPGPTTQPFFSLAQQIEALVKRRDPTASRQPASLLSIRDQQVNFRVVDGRVHHQNLEFQVGDVDMRSQGSVGLDETISLTLSIPIQDAWIAKEPLLAGLKGQSLSVPVTGTLRRPQMDQRAVASLSGQLIQNAAGQAVGNELNKALDKFLKPRQ
jgi:hypothetical protein